MVFLVATAKERNRLGQKALRRRAGVLVQTAVWVHHIVRFRASGPRRVD
jgi:hypothetical protein